MDDIIRKICREHRLYIIKWFKAGNICDAVCKVKNTEENIYVLKIGSEQRSIAEIVKNSIGYTKMKENNLDWFIPKILALKIHGKYAYILMEYCGDDFLKQSKTVAAPTELYLQLIKELEKLYNLSLKEGPEGKIAVLSVIDKVTEQYEVHIPKRLDKKRHWPEKLKRMRKNFETENLNFYCFSHWDFTPEDVYLTPLGLKYSDPHENIFGIPIIDLACFAGVARDAYELPGSEEGYQLLKGFSLQTISEMLHLHKDTAQRLFYLGRVLQCLLSVRFRIKSESDKAEALFDKGYEYLKKIT